MRAMRPHQLSDEMEKYLHDASVVGASAWNKLFDETMAGLMFTVAGEEEDLNLEATLNLLTDPDRTKREAASRALAAVFDKHIKLFARVHNTLAKEKEIDDRWRKMPSPQYSRHLGQPCRTRSGRGFAQCRGGSLPQTQPPLLQAESEMDGS